MIPAAAQCNLLIEVLLVYAIATTLRVGMFSIAPVGIAACSGYSVAILTTRYHWGFTASLAVSVAGSLVLGLILALPLLRLVGVYAGLATLAFLIMIQGLASSFSITGGTNGIYDIPFADERIPLIIFVVINMALLYIVDRSYAGRHLDTIAKNPVLAATMGIPVAGYRLVILGYASILSAIAGAMYARSFYVITPDVFSFQLALTISALAVIGGAGHWFTPLFATVTVGLIPIAFTSLENWAAVLQGVLMAVVMVLYPDGLAGFVRRWLLPSRVNMQVGSATPREKAVALL